MTGTKSKRSAWRIGEILLQKEWISWAQLSSALSLQSHQKYSRELLGEILVHEKVLNRRQVFRALALQCGIPFLNLEKYPVEHEALNAVPAFFVRRYRFLPVMKESTSLTLCVSNPFNFFLMALIAETTGIHDIRFALALQEDIENAIRRYYGMSSENAA